MPKKPAVIMDLDGTICDNRHRQHFIKQIPQDWTLYDKFTKDWEQFDAHMYEDAVYPSILAVIADCYKNGIKVLFVTGRRATLQNVRATNKWIVNNIRMNHPIVHFRDVNDFRDATLVKRDIYIKEIRRKYDVQQVFDDEKRILNMYAEFGIKGILCIEGEMWEKIR